MNKFLIATLAMLSLFGGRAMAQRNLPGMSAVEIKANMVDGFYTGKSRDCGYALGVSYLIFKGEYRVFCLFGVYHRHIVLCAEWLDYLFLHGGTLNHFLVHDLE